LTTGDESDRLAVDKSSGVFSEGPGTAWVDTAIKLFVAHVASDELQVTLGCIDEIEEERVGGVRGSLFTENPK
jgi:hypothetical protein